MATNNQLNTPEPFAITSGGTGVTSVTTAPAATAWAGWDANKNLSANNLIEGYTTTVTGATTTTLVVGSTWQQFFTGSTTQTVLLPVTSTLALGQSFFIVNNSSGSVTVQSSGANNIQVMASNTTLIVTCILTSGTTAASWYADYNLQSALTLPLSLGNGGTGQSLISVNSAVFSTTSGGTSQLSTTLPSGLAATNMGLTTPSLGTPSSGTLTSCTGYTIANLSDVAWTDISGGLTFAGITSVSVAYARAKIIGKTCFFNISLTATGNGTNFGITGLPVTSVSVATEGGFINAVNNSVTVTNANWVIAASSTSITLKLGNNGSGWTASGGRDVFFQGFYETA